MKKTLGVTLVLLALSVTGCSEYWEEPTTITLKNATLVECTKGVGFTEKVTVRCYYDRGHGMFKWEEIGSIARKSEKKN